MNADPKKKEIISDLLGVFPQTNNPHKLVIDKAGKIIDIYAALTEEPGVHYWLQFMSDFPSSWEAIDVDNIQQATNNEEVFMMVCCQTSDKILITYNHNGWTKHLYRHKRHIYYDDKYIRVLDREEAVKLLALSEEEAIKLISTYENDLGAQTINYITNNFTDSIVAQDGSSIDGAKIKKR